MTGGSGVEVGVDAVALVGGAIVFIVWLARLEFITNQNKKDIEDIWREHEKHVGDIERKWEDLRRVLHSMNGSLSRIEGQLDTKKDDK